MNDLRIFAVILEFAVLFHSSLTKSGQNMDKLVRSDYIFRIQKRSGHTKLPFLNSHQGCSECGTRTIQHQPEKVGPDRPIPKIVGGSSPPYGAYPWQVEIQTLKNANSWEHHCGGALIEKNLVLTAAHCVQNIPNTELRLIAGEHTLSQPDKYEKVYDIQERIIHPDFRKEGPHSNDIAILKLRKSNNSTEHEIACGSHIQPICLPESQIRSKDVGDWCSVSGWGTQKHGSTSISMVLRAASVPLLDLATCRMSDVYGSANTQSILNSMICAGTLEGGVDACGGDSGGPLACKISGRFVLLGVVSWGDGCARKNRPGVYTRVSYFLPWIRESMLSLKSNR